MNINKNAVIKRINRKLAHSNLALRTSRGDVTRGGYGFCHHTPYGSFYMIERYTGFIVVVSQNLELLARGLGVLAKDETMYQPECWSTRENARGITEIRQV